ncbi:uncharacterized protein [Coffea arabica]|uniref:Uncharacterized protein isoform X3 n=1 Tax=Coffea arabica TaxID=13443 RepID=A0ABM4VNR8_COFAR
MGELQQLYYLPPPPLPPPTAPPPTPPPPLSSHDERSPSASHQEPPPSPRFDPSRMVGIIRRKALIKDLAAVYHAECLTYCQELLELQSKLEEIFEQLRLKEIEGCIGCILHQMGRVKHLEAREPHVKSKAMIKFWTYEKEESEKKKNWRGLIGTPFDCVKNKQSLKFSHRSENSREFQERNHKAPKTPEEISLTIITIGSQKV